MHELLNYRTLTRTGRMGGLFPEATVVDSKKSWWLERCETCSKMFLRCNFSHLNFGPPIFQNIPIYNQKMGTKTWHFKVIISTVFQRHLCCEERRTVAIPGKVEHIEPEGVLGAIKMMRHQKGWVFGPQIGWLEVFGSCLILRLHVHSFIARCSFSECFFS